MDTPQQPDPPTPGRTVITPLRSILAALAVISLCSALSIGGAVRDRLDEQRGGPKAPLPGLQASNQKGTVGISLDAYYEAVEQKLKDYFVEPINDESKLAIGAVHGMVTSLGDPRSQYMDKDAFTRFQQEQEGHFSGIGADFDMQPTTIDLSAEDQVTSDTDPTSDFTVTRIPRLVINSVVPGGPADQAGIKAGDWVDAVDGHWVIDPIKIAHYRKVTRAHRLAVAANSKAPKPSATPDEFESLTRELRGKLESAIFPPRAVTLLSAGSSGKVTLRVAHEGQPMRTLVVNKADVNGGGNQVANGVIRLRFGQDAPAFLKNALKGMSSATIDLRGEPQGYFTSMKACLQLVAPAGTYGMFDSHREGENPAPFKITSGNSNPPKLTLLVDGSVRGSAAIFALALNSAGIAKLSGSEVASDRSRVTVERLPDGSGFTLVTGEYSIGKGGKS